MKEFLEKNKESILALAPRIVFFSLCFVFSYGLNHYLTTYIDKRLESVPIVLFFVFLVATVTRSEYKKMTIANLGQVSLLKFEKIYEKYGYTIQLPGYVEHDQDQCVISYANNQEKDWVEVTSAFRIFNQYVKIPFVFDYRKDRVIIKSQKAVINLDDISLNDLEEFNPNISNFLKLEYKLSADKKKLILTVSDGSKYNMLLDYKNIEHLKTLKYNSAF